MSEPKAYKAKLADKFKSDQNNLNRHTQRGQRLVENSQRKRGFGRPGFAASDGTMLGGNLSVMEVAPGIDLGDGEVFIIESDGDIPIVHLRRDVKPGSEAAALLAAEDNQSALKSINYDPEILLAEIERGIDFDGIFEVDEIKEILRELETELGQLWALGEHRLICGDCTDRGTVEKVMGGEKAFLCLTDPPYGIDINSNTNCFGVAVDKSRKATSESWDKSRPDKKAFEFIFIFSDEQIIFGANYFWEYFYSSGCYIIWDKRGDLPNVPFADTEFAWTSFVDRSSKRYVVINHGFIRDEQEERFHPTQKPVKLFRLIIDDFTKKSELILDPFLGSGTTLIAAHTLNHRCFGIELSPSYVAICLQRFLDYAEIEPVLLSECDVSCCKI